MQTHQDLSPAHYTFRSYGPGQVTLRVPEDAAKRSEARLQTLTRSCVVTPHRLVTDWPPQAFGEVARVHFELISALDPEIVLFGSGASLQFPRVELLAPLTSRGIGVEAMDTGAACRTYNILTADGRKVAAALLMIGAA
jgi:uncharacterized protein